MSSNGIGQQEADSNIFDSSQNAPGELVSFVLTNGLAVKHDVTLGRFPPLLSPAEIQFD